MYSNYISKEAAVFQRDRSMSLTTISGVGGVLALAATIVLFIMVMPKSKDGKLGNKFLQFAHDYFHFKTLYIEMILKFIFAFATLSCILCGFLMLFGKIGYSYYAQSTAGYGLLLMIAGPIVIRIVYEFTMMLILLVKNVMDINNKLKGTEPEVVFEQPGEPVIRYCIKCGTQYDASVMDKCPNCGFELDD